MRIFENLKKRLRDIVESVSSGATAVYRYSINFGSVDKPFVELIITDTDASLSVIQGDSRLFDLNEEELIALSEFLNTYVRHQAVPVEKPKPTMKDWKDMSDMLHKDCLKEAHDYMNYLYCSKVLGGDCK